jgi:hypothetical protein
MTYQKIRFFHGIITGGFSMDGHMSKPWRKMVEIAPFVPQLGPIAELMGGVML